MKALKMSYIDKFQIHPFKTADAVSVSIFDKDGKLHLLEVLWDVAGTNVVSLYCEEISMALDHMKTADFRASTHKRRKTK